jgi:hypothetical protein
MLLKHWSIILTYKVYSIISSIKKRWILISYYLSDKPEIKSHFVISERKEEPIVSTDETPPVKLTGPRLIYYFREGIYLNYSEELPKNPDRERRSKNIASLLLLSASHFKDLAVFTLTMKTEPVHKQAAPGQFFTTERALHYCLPPIQRM